MLPLFIAYIIANGTVQSAYLGLAALVLVVTLPLNAWLLLEAPDTLKRQKADAISTGRQELRPILRTGNFIVLAIAFFLLGFFNTGLVTNQISLLIDAGATPAHAAFVQSVFGLSVLIGRFLTGVLLDYVPAKRLMTLVCIGGMLACCLYAAGSTGAVTFVCAILIGAIYGAEFDVLSYVIKRYFGLATFGRIYGLIFAAFQLGAALGATLLPLSRVYFASYAPGLLVYAAALAISAILFLFFLGAPPRSDRSR